MHERELLSNRACSVENNSIHFLLDVSLTTVLAEKLIGKVNSCPQITRLREMSVSGIGQEFHLYSSMRTASRPALTKSLSWHMILTLCS